MAKNILLYFLLFLPILDVCADTTRDCVVERYTSYIGVKEATGNNDGPFVEYFLGEVGMAKGNSWCAAFVATCLNECNVKHSINAWSPTAHNKKNVVYEKGKWLKEPLPADVLTLYSYSKKRIAHTGFYHAGKKTVESVEGNVNAQGTSFNGGGVYRRYRPIGTIHSITRWIND